MPMYDFGCQAAARAGLEVYLQAARGGGRSTLVLDAARDGDVILIGEKVPTRFFCDQLQRRKVKASVIPCGPWDLTRVAELRAEPPRRVLADHTWVESFYRAVIESAAEELQLFAKHWNMTNPAPQPQPASKPDTAWPLREAFNPGSTR